MSSAQDDNIVEVKDMKMYFPVTRGLFRRKVGDVKAVDGISFHIKRGETFGLVGESGSGKTTVGRCVMRLLQPSSGNIIFEGKDISTVHRRKIKPILRKMSLIFQDPYGSLDPRQSAGSIVGEPLIVHGLTKSKKEYVERVEELLTIVGLDPSMKDRVPHEFSGGQRQRIGIARALAGESSLIICDEPVSALDVSIQAQIINLLKRLQKNRKDLTYLFIAHDLAVVRHLSDRIAVMYLGRIVEITDYITLYNNPLHPYTKALLSAIPVADPFVEEKRERIILQGEVPSPLNPPSGCNFHTRCPDAVPECSLSIPTLKNIEGYCHQVACFRV